MTKYWSIAPWPNNEPQAFDHVWQYDQREGVIVIGWDQAGDPTGLSWAQLTASFTATIPQWIRGRRQVWQFYNEIQPDDVILARQGVKLCIGLGRVTSAPWFDVAAGQARIGGLSKTVRLNFIRVEWQRLFTPPITVQNQFHQITVNKIDPSQYADVLS